jgi:lipopolysaccharide transport system ATP-binding protein
MSNTVIKAEGISKLYRLGEVGTGTLSHDLNRWWAKIRGKEDPFSKLGDTNDRTTKDTSGYVWALKDLDFDIAEGEAVGIIGRNGAGKSTLLKILSRTTLPTNGNIKIKGRIASLLEVGTGFHPELSGRDNIYLNGAILGMNKAEISRKFDAIVDFAGVERYIDTPVKRYSSGMYVRLAFGVAAHLEPEILIVDEVLAVGDAEFQKKALGKMRDVSSSEGRTVLFVSHNMGAISQLCSKAMVMHQGRILSYGSVSSAIDYYLQSGISEAGSEYVNSSPKPSDILRIQLLDKKEQISNSFGFDEDIIFHFNVQLESTIVETAYVGFRIMDKGERNVFTTQIRLSDYCKRAGNYTIRAKIPKGVLVPNSYSPMVALHIPNQRVINYLESPVRFTVEETGTDFFQYAGNDYGCVFVNCDWSIYAE